MQPWKALTRRRAASIAAGLFFFLILVAGGIALRSENAELTAAQKRTFAVAEVTDILADDAQPEPWSEGLRLGAQTVELEICSGPYEGTILEATNYLSAYSNVDCTLGTRVIVRLDLDDNGQPYVISIPNYDRGIVLAGMVAVFALLLVVIGGKKGVMALLGLAYTLAGIWFLLIPMVLKGADPIWSAVLIAALTAVASLLMLTGFSRKTPGPGLRRAWASSETHIGASASGWWSRTLRVKNSMRDSSPPNGIPLTACMNRWMARNIARPWSASCFSIISPRYYLTMLFI